MFIINWVLSLFKKPKEEITLVEMWPFPVETEKPKKQIKKKPAVKKTAVKKPVVKKTTTRKPKAK